MSKVACALHINFEPGCWECDDANPSTEAEPERICGRTEASCHADRDAMTSELAEARDRLATIVDETVGIHPVLTTDELLTLLEKWAHETRIDRDEARRMLAECERERDAYRDGRYAGPWQPVADHHNGEGYSRAGAAFVGRRRDGRYEWNCAGFRSDLAETAAGAKAAADAHLVAAGWWLEQGK